MIPREGDPTAERLLRKVRLLAVRSLLLAPRAGLPRVMQGDLTGIQKVAGELLRRDPDALLRAASSMDVLPSLLVLASRAAPAPGVLSAVVPHLLGELRSSLPGPLSWRTPIRRMTRGDDLVEFDRPARALVADPSEVSIELNDGRHVTLADLPGRSVRRPLAAGHLALVDTFPLADQEAHPEKEGNALDLGGRPASAWVEALDGALALVGAALPALRREMGVTLQRAVPVGFQPQRHLSASYREAPGLVYLTLHPDPLTMAEALVHETQHGKLNLLSWLDPILHNGRSTWTRSPVRPDLRPLSGVLLAAHAFVPVAALHRALAEADHPIAATGGFAQRRADVLASNAESLEILADKAEPTDVGGSVLDDLQRRHRDLEAAYQR